MKIDIIAGARPNFMKIAPIIEQIKISQINNSKIQFRLIHTGQHYDKNMSDNFFKQLDIPKPDINLGVGSGSQSKQTSKIMIGYENLVIKDKPDYCMVVGDVNSTMACSIVAKKNDIKVIHVEAGIRSWDNTMPEEINRIVTDSITDYFFTTSEFANKNLLKCGVSKDKIFFVGNTMIDTLLKHRPNFSKPKIWNQIGLNKKKFIVMTLHRPSNVDDKEKLNFFLNEIVKNCNGIPLIFPTHPRTEKQINSLKNIHVYFLS